jgi:hypothetical protein
MKHLRTTHLSSLALIAIATSVAAPANAALYNFTYSSQSVTTVVDGWTTTIDVAATGQISVENGVIIGGSMSVVDNSFVNYYGEISNTVFTGENLTGNYSLFAGDGSGQLQSQGGMGFDNLFNTALTSPFTVVESSSFSNYYTAGGALFTNQNGPFGSQLFAFTSTASGEIFVKLRTSQFDASRIDSGTFTYSAVPAPGAIALLGLAGLVGRRRR